MRLSSGGVDREPPLYLLSHWFSPARGAAATGLSARQSGPPGSAPPPSGVYNGNSHGPGSGNQPAAAGTGPAERLPRAEHTLAPQLPPSRFMTARSARSLRQSALHLRCRPPSATARAPRGKEGSKAGAAVRPAEPATPARSPLAPCCPRAAPACSRPTCCSCWCSCPRLAATAPPAPG